MSQTLALIPAKRHSQGVPDKNWKPILGDNSCTQLAWQIAMQTCERVVLSTDADIDIWKESKTCTLVRRPDGLPDAMLDVVKHALSVVPGPDDEIIVLLQPTSPLRTVETVKKAIQMLQDDLKADSVVSVAPSYPIQWSLTLKYGGLAAGEWFDLSTMPATRQACEPTFKRDGVVYAFRRRNQQGYFGTIYGDTALPLHTPPEESLSIDTPEDWDEAVRRLQARAAATGSPTAR